MLRKIAVVGATAAAIVGVGTAALAESGSTSSTTGSPSSTSSTASTHAADKAAGKGKHDRKHRDRDALRRALHAQITTKAKDGFVTRSEIRGTVTAVSATSVTVKAADGYTQTYTLAKTTKVRERPADGAKGKATKGTVSDVKSGDRVEVLGRSVDKSAATAGTPTATVIVDGLTK